MGFASLASVVGVSALIGGSALEVNFQKDFSSYHVQHAGTEIFAAKDGVAMFCDGAWHSQLDGSLKLVGSEQVSGNEVGLGKYSGTQDGITARAL